MTVALKEALSEGIPTSREEQLRNLIEVKI